jgi:S-adenosylmethionine/arginine decarboxylase-like enzyme
MFVQRAEYIHSFIHSFTMGETLIDIRVWFAMLVIAFGFGRVDLTKTNTPVNEIVPDATITTCKSSDTALSEPFGQHLALDVKGIKADLLNSEDYLIKVITDAVDALDLHLMSCNCQKLSKTGISCLGVLDQAQISVQAWPKHGAIAVDLFTEGSKSLVPAANVLKGVLNAEGDNVTSFWSIDYRGEAVNDRHTDLYHFALNSMIAPVKKELLSMEINGQKLDIWEFVEIDDTVGHEDSIAYNLQPGDPRWTNNELARPEKECYLNGRFILSNDDESKQMLEAPVLTGMITQENPKQIAMGKTCCTIHPSIRDCSVSHPQIHFVNA